jgi:hypothetical protein
LGLRLLEVLSTDEIDTLGDYPIYYNASFNPSRSETG